MGWLSRTEVVAAPLASAFDGACNSKEEEDEEQHGELDTTPSRTPSLVRAQVMDRD